MRPLPLRALAALLVAYLLIPIGVFGWKLASDGTDFGVRGLGSAVVTSVVSATISTAIIGLLGIPLALWLARSRSRLRHIVDVVVQLPLALPPVMSGIVLVYVIGPYTWLGKLFGGNLTDTLAGVVIAQVFVASPFLIIAARSAFESVSPHLDELAATLGHRPLARFFKVDLPIAARGISAGLMLSWLRALGEFGATVLVAYHPSTLPVFTYVQFSGTGVPGTLAPTALALGVAIVVLLLVRLRRPRRRAVSRLPEARAPQHPEPTAIAFDLSVRAGDFTLAVAHQATSHRLAILGPSGAGKSMTLRALAGLLGPVGAVTFGESDVADTDVESRNIGYVPQDHGLFPHRTAWQNAVFATGSDHNLAAWWLRELQIDDVRDRRPDQLSGGQRQRVSLVQALSHEPRILLLDEPFSALDAPIRGELRALVRQLQRDANVSTVLVTHDAEEAAMLADEVIVIAGGRVLQAGSVEDVFRRPISAEVSRLVGNTNVGTAISAGAGGLVVGGSLVAATHQVPAGRSVLFAIRPEQIKVGGTVPAMIQDWIDLGSAYLLTVRIGDVELQVRTSDKPTLDRCRLSLPSDAISVWPQ